MGASNRSAVERSRGRAHYRVRSFSREPLVVNAVGGTSSARVISFFRDKSARDAAALAYRRVVAQARQPAFFTEYGVPDTFDGRFELICLHAFLYLHRLKSERPRRAGLCQAFSTRCSPISTRRLREIGIGDLSVGQQVKRMAQGFYGRVRAYEEGIAGERFGSWAPHSRAISSARCLQRPRPRCDDSLCPQRGDLLAGAADGGADRRPGSLRPSADPRRLLGRGFVMTETAPEFSRIVPLSQLGSGSFRLRIEATAERTRPAGAPLRPSCTRSPDRHGRAASPGRAERSARCRLRGPVLAGVRRHPRTGRGCGCRNLLADLRPGRGERRRNGARCARRRRSSRSEVTRSTSARRWRKSCPWRCPISARPGGDD